MENVCLTIAYVSLFENVLYSESGMKKNKELANLMLYNVTAITFMLSKFINNAVIMTMLRYYFLIELRQDQKIIKEKSNFFVRLNRAG